MADKPLHAHRFELPYKAVRIRVLDAKKNPLKTASGFITFENNQLYLYTCWHVITGYDLNHLEVKLPPERCFLEINLQQNTTPQQGVEVIGGKKIITISLYDQIDFPRKPLWEQDESYIPHPDLEAINLKVPFWHDLVRFPLYSDISISDIQLIKEEEPASMLLPGEKVLIVGYPYGYSSLGEDQPTPIVITRHIAATSISERRTEILLDGYAANGMSGGPVFAERNQKLVHIGAYTGLIYPDYPAEQRERTTALGTVCSMLLLKPSYGLKMVKCDQILTEITPPKNSNALIKVDELKEPFQIGEDLSIQLKKS